MDIQAEKINIIKQIQQINDIDLIKAFKGILDYAKQKEKIANNIEIPDSHKEIVRDRVKKYKTDPDTYLTLNDLDIKLKQK